MYIKYIPLIIPLSASINKKSPFPLPSASPIVEIITSPLGEQCVVCKADTLKPWTSLGSMVYRYKSNQHIVSYSVHLHNNKYYIH